MTALDLLCPKCGKGPEEQRESLCDLCGLRPDRVGGYYDREGRRISLLTWGRLFEDFDYKRVDYTELNNDLFVSTVWLGLDHSFWSGPPLIFESMVCSGREDRFDERDMARYSTEAQARSGHAELVRKWSS